MGTTHKTLEIGAARFRSTLFARPVKDNGTNIPVFGLAFATNETAFFQWPFTGYGAGNVTGTILWYAGTATSGTATWGMALAAITAGTDTTNVTTKALATENTNTSACRTDTKAVATVDVVVSNLDSLANFDLTFLRVRRTDSSVSGDCIILGIRLSYSDT